MPFSLDNLCPLGGQSSDSLGLWSYKTADTTAEINTSGYFNDASDRLKVGDIILSVQSTTAGVPTDVYFYVVQSNASNVVDVFDAFTVATTLIDTD